VPEARLISGARSRYVRLKPVKRNIWLEIIVEVNWLSREEVKAEHQECSELLAIFTSIGKGLSL
jgi:hypothetical protein